MIKKQKYIFIYRTTHDCLTLMPNVKTPWFITLQGLEGTVFMLILCLKSYEMSENVLIGPWHLIIGYQVAHFKIWWCIWSQCQKSMVIMWYRVNPWTIGRVWLRSLICIILFIRQTRLKMLNDSVMEGRYLLGLIWLYLFRCLC